MGKEQLLERATRLIGEIDLKIEEVDKLEDCEAISAMITSEVLDLIQDPDLKKAILWLKTAHDVIPSIRRWRRNFAEVTKRLFEKAGGGERVKRYHELEQVCDSLQERDLESLTDARLTETIRAVKHVHDDMLERRINLVKRIHK